MEQKTAYSHQKISYKADEEDAIMAILSTIVDANIREVKKEEVGEGIHDLRGVWRGVVVLNYFSRAQ